MTGWGEKNRWYNTAETATAVQDLIKCIHYIENASSIQGSFHLFRDFLIITGLIIPPL